MTRREDINEVAKLLADLEAACGMRSTVPAPVPVEPLPPRPLREMLDELAASDPERLPWPADWLDVRTSGEVRACRTLWQAVLMSCLRSAMGEITSFDHQSGSQQVSVSWIGGRDFHLVCALAGFDGDAVASRLAKMRETPEGVAGFLERSKAPSAHRRRPDE